MEQLHVFGIEVISRLQNWLGNYDDLMLVLSHLGDPRNAFLLYFPLAYCIHKPTGVAVLWLAALSEWMNAILKWLLYGQRPYWWVKESGLYPGNSTLIKQYPLTCETGPGSPSGHAMVTASVLFCIVTSLLSQCKPRFAVRGVIWCMYVGFMMAASLSRCFISTHFPHQVVFGTLVGIALTVLFNKVNKDNLQVKHYVGSAILIPVSCLILYTIMNVLDLDPGWSITLATKWCQNKRWIHLDTTPFNAVFRDSGSLIGYGLVVMVSQIHTWRKKEAPGYGVKLIHIVLALMFSQVIEQLKLPMVDPVKFYSVTFVKFCLLVVGIHITTCLYLSDAEGTGLKSKAE